MSKGKVTEARVADLIPDDKNFNKGTEYGNALLENSFQKFGAGRSILLDKNNRIIAGNKAAGKYGELGGEKVIVVETDGDTLVAVKRTDVDLDSQAGRELALADNATQRADLEWDTEVVKEVSEQWEIDAAAWGVDMPGSLAAAEATEDDFDEDADAVEPRCKLGDIWQLGEHRLMCGDSTKEEDVSKLMQGELADLCITDPPYGVSYTDKNEYLNRAGTGHRLTRPIENDNKSPQDMYSFWVAAFSMLRKFSQDKMAYYITAPQGGDLLLLLLLLQAVRDSGFMLKHQLIWNKNNHVLGRCDYDYKHEPIIYGWKINGTHHFVGGGKFKTSVWDIPKPLSSKLHPTMKPIELFSEMMLDNSVEGQIVLDLFGGSGTTMIAAEQLGRKSRLMELDPHYCDVIIARWEKLTGKTAIRINE